MADAVQHHPVGALLVEAEIGLAPDVEAVPGEDRFLFGLLDGDIGAAVRAGALHRALGAGPQRRIDLDPRCGLQAALAEAVGDGIERRAGGDTRLHLRVLHLGAGLRGAAERLQCALRGAVRLGLAQRLILRRARRDRAGIAARAAALARPARLRRSRAGQHQRAQRSADQQLVAEGRGAGHRRYSGRLATAPRAARCSMEKSDRRGRRRSVTGGCRSAARRGVRG